MNVVGFYKVGNHYIKVVDDSGFCYQDLDLYHVDQFSEINNGDLVPGPWNGAQSELNIKYKVKKEGRAIIFAPVIMHFPVIFQEWIIRRKVRYAKEKIAIFRLKTKEEFLRGVYGHYPDLKDVLLSIQKYLFADDISLWMYSGFSNAFTSVESSFKRKFKFKLEKDESTLNRTLDDQYKGERRKVEGGCTNSYHDENHEYLIRRKIKIDGVSSFCVLTIYSSHQDFDVNDVLLNEIENLVSVHMRGYVESKQSSLVDINDFIISESSKFESAESFLIELSKTLCEKLSYEACSIFMVSPNRDRLSLVAISDLLHSGKPSEKFDYRLEDASLTAEVFKSGKMYFSYDIEKDPENSHQYNECVKEAATNWIGIPIKEYPNGDSSAVIRLKNKYKSVPEGRRVVPPDEMDVSILRSVQSHVENVLSGRAKLYEIVKEQKEQKRFKDVFLHEVKSPISTFSSYPEMIKRHLDEHIEGAVRDKVFTKLEDMCSVAERLRFLVDSYNFDKIISSRNIETLFLMRDVLQPVFKEQIYWHRKQGVIFDIDDTALISKKVFVDKRFVQLAVTAVIDNAAKYCDESVRTVKIWAESLIKEGKLKIMFQNGGCGICDDEVEMAFDEGFRGQLALESGQHGNGIGLFMVKELLESIGCEAVIESGINPFRIALYLPGGDF